METTPYLVRLPGGYYVSENKRSTFPEDAQRFTLGQAQGICNKQPTATIVMYKLAVKEHLRETNGRLY